MKYLLFIIVTALLVWFLWPFVVVGIALSCMALLVNEIFKLFGINFN